MGMSRRTILVGLCGLAGIMVALAAVELTTGSQRWRPRFFTSCSGGEGAHGLKAYASKCTYEPGEQVHIQIILTNRGTAPCRAVNWMQMPSAMTVAAMTRDGQPVHPEVRKGVRAGRFSSEADLKVVLPGATLPAPWHSWPSSTQRRLSLIGWDGDDAASFPVNVPGRYELTVGYVVPPMKGAPADLCRIPDTDVVRFVVAGGK